MHCVGLFKCVDVCSLLSGLKRAGAKRETFGGFSWDLRLQPRLTGVDLSGYPGLPRILSMYPDPIFNRNGQRAKKIAVYWRYAAVGTFPDVHAHSAHTISRTERAVNSDTVWSVGDFLLLLENLPV